MIGGAVARSGGASRAGRIRWIVCALLFAATMLNYLDRQVIGLLKPVLQARFGWSEIDYGNITFFFQAASTRSATRSAAG